MARNKVITAAEAVGMIKHGARIMIGGFLLSGSPNTLTDALFEAGQAELTVISNDSAFMEKGVGELIVHHRIKRLICSHIGTNPETGRQMGSGELCVELVPQGTLAERIRACGAGLGGIITPTGIGTLVAEGKQQIVLGGREYLIEMPLGAEIALIKAEVADRFGNLHMRGSALNMNTVMATAADIVIAEVNSIVEIGELMPEQVTVPGIYVDYIVQGDQP